MVEAWKPAFVNGQKLELLELPLDVLQTIFELSWDSDTSVSWRASLCLICKALLPVGCAFGPLPFSSVVNDVVWPVLAAKLSIVTLKTRRRMLLFLVHYRRTQQSRLSFEVLS